MLGSGIAPFFPIVTPVSKSALPLHMFLAIVRIPLLLGVTLAYFLFFCWFPIGSLGKKFALWLILGVPGIWWVDLQVDGVKKGSLGSHVTRLPHPGSVIAASCTSPIDALYLAAIFDPLFTQSYPNTRKVRRLTLWQAMLNALCLSPSSRNQLPDEQLVDLATLCETHPRRCIAVFPECTTTNGRGVLPFSPSLLTVPPTTKIFPVSLRYTPADITTPVPGYYFAFLWNLCSRPTHTIRVRIAEPTYNTSRSNISIDGKRNGYEARSQDDTESSSDDDSDEGSHPGLRVSSRELAVLDRIAEALARLGRSKRVGLGFDAKCKFVQQYNRKK